MPELPEVETIARELRPLVSGALIRDAWFDWPNQIKHPAPELFVDALRGRRILGVERRAKWLIFELSESAVLAVQVKMTGQLLVLPAGEPRDSHVHAVLSFEDGRELRLRDTRKFGRLGVYRRDAAGRLLGADDETDLLAQFGPEPLDDGFRARDLRALLGRRRGRLKTLLMNQAFVAGVGNIYADEALWRAQLHPLRSAAGLNAVQARRLYHALREVLSEAVARRGSSVDDYLAPEGRGEMQHFLNVYGRAGRPCPRCGRPIRRIVINARSTHFCSWCQRLPAADRPRPGSDIAR
ncbi:MAG TPA: bifunctional DNA-formamidopyrimidine glycosylase/DNA-(apurinic or apyrimidinic site) lyase [Candidatus Limnocylindrales bacterium]|jgi:formamidopyrimidine-DNA glycosylase|nr:bifunctional DNA-formamidopyrimidine glycosylase/DNA-(apurinic or apyrimidinic site) lyase [Candidatus Limnocylindrales bacterium]